MSVHPKKNRRTGQVVPGAWIIDYRPQGWKGPRIQRAFGSPEDPRTEGEALALEMELRRLSRREPVDRINPRVFELIPEWKVEYKNSHEPTTVRDLEGCLVYLSKFFGPLYLAEITPAIIEQYKGQRLTDRHRIPRKKNETDEEYEARRAEAPLTSKRSINKELSYLSGFLRWAHEHGYSSNQVRVKLFPARQAKAAKARPLHPKEVEKMLEHLEEHYHLPFFLYNDAGLRRSEVLGGGKYDPLKAEDVDLKFNLIYVRGKGDKERIVPITTARLRQALKKQIDERKNGPLCINPGTKKPWYSIRKALIRAAEAAGIERRVYTHLLRHNFGTHAVAAGINLRTVQEIMGHSTIKTTEVYTHMAPYLHEEAAKLGRFLETSTREKAKHPKQSKKKAKPKAAKN